MSTLQLLPYDSYIGVTNGAANAVSWWRWARREFVISAAEARCVTLRLVVGIAVRIWTENKRQGGGRKEMEMWQKEAGLTRNRVKRFIHMWSREKNLLLNIFVS